MNFKEDGWLDWDGARRSTLIVSPFDEEGKLEVELDGYRGKYYVFQSGQTSWDRDVPVGSMRSYEKDDASLDHLNVDMVLLGHGDYLDRITNGRGEDLTTTDVARFLVQNDLPRDYSKRIWVWTCHGGVPGGFAQNLYMRLFNLGYRSLGVTGPRYITHMIPGVIPGVQSVPVGETAEGETLYDYRAGKPGEPKRPWSLSREDRFENLRQAKRQDFLHYGRDWTTI